MNCGEVIRFNCLDGISFDIFGKRVFQMLKATMGQKEITIEEVIVTATGRKSGDRTIEDPKAKKETRSLANGNATRRAAMKNSPRTAALTMTMTSTTGVRNRKRRKRSIKNTKNTATRKNIKSTKPGI